MPEAIREGLILVVHALEIVGASALVVGFVLATVRWLLNARAVERYRQSLGRSILMGLEILVAATIIKTITLEPTVQSVALLGCMVLVRTILGWTTVLEMNGRWPWQPPRAD